MQLTAFSFSVSSWKIIPVDRALAIEQYTAFSGLPFALLWDVHVMPLKRELNIELNINHVLLLIVPCYREPEDDKVNMLIWAYREVTHVTHANAC